MNLHTNSQNTSWQTVAECTVRGIMNGAVDGTINGAVSDEEMQASLQRIASAVRLLCLPETRVTQLQAALADAVYNAMAHTTGDQCDLAVSMRVLAPTLECLQAGLDDGRLAAAPGDDNDAGAPGGEDQPNGRVRGWGFFVIEKTAGACQLGDPVHHMIDLFLYVEGEGQ